MKVWTLILKEWSETLRDRMILISIVVPPLLFVAVPAVAVRMPDVGTLKPDTLEELYRLSPFLRGADPQDVTKVVLINQFMLFFLLMPVFVPLTIAVHSIIGEKQNRTLEPLLATPITTLELLLGKSLSAAIPAIVTTWASFAILYLSSLPVASQTLRAAILHPKWVLAITVIAPMLCMFGVNLAILLSARLNDTRAAQQIGVMFVLPIVGLGVAQTVGKVFLGIEQFVLGAMALAIINILMLRLVVRIFHRETILTRWR